MLVFGQLLLVLQAQICVILAMLGYGLPLGLQCAISVV